MILKTYLKNKPKYAHRKVYCHSLNESITDIYENYKYLKIRFKVHGRLQKSANFAGLSHNHLIFLQSHRQYINELSVAVFQ